MCPQENNDQNNDAMVVVMKSSNYLIGIFNGMQFNRVQQHFASALRANALFLTSRNLRKKCP